MRTTSNADINEAVDDLMQALRELGRKRPLRDPIALAVEEMQATPAQVHTLMWLGTDGKLTMGDLATRVGITEKTITGVVDRLEREEYVHRVRSDSDRRVVHVSLTRKGQTTFRRFSSAIKQRLAGFLSFIDAEDRCALIRIIKTITQRVPAPTLTLTPPRPG